MLVLPKKTSHPLHTDSILEINRVTSRAEDYTGIHNINRVTQSESLSSAEAAPFTVSRASETPMSSRVSNPLPSYRRSAQQNTFTSSAPSGISRLPESFAFTFCSPSITSEYLSKSPAISIALLPLSTMSPFILNSFFTLSESFSAIFSAATPSAFISVSFMRK